MRTPFIRLSVMGQAAPPAPPAPTSAWDTAARHAGSVLQTTGETLRQPGVLKGAAIAAGVVLGAMAVGKLFR